MSKSVPFGRIFYLGCCLSVSDFFFYMQYTPLLRYCLGGKSIEISWEVLELNANVSKVLEGHRVKKCAFWKKILPRLLSLRKLFLLCTYMHYAYTPLRILLREKKCVNCEDDLPMTIIEKFCFHSISF